MPIKSVKMKISKNKKMRFFLMSQGSLDPKIRFIGQKVCSVAREQTDKRTHTHTHTDTHESEYRGHPFRVSGIFPSTYHQGLVQQKVKTGDSFHDFRRFLLQPVTKEWSNNNHHEYSRLASQSGHI